MASTPTIHRHYRIIAKVVFSTIDEPFVLGRDTDVNEIKLTYTMACGAGHQTWKWLGLLVCSQFTRDYGYRDGEFLPINILSAERLTLFPYDIISDRCLDGEVVIVEILDQSKNFPSAREPTLWELFAYTDVNQFIRVPISFARSNELQAHNDVCLVGNFNGWSVPVQMQGSDKATYRTVITVPPGSIIVFRFIVNGFEQLGEKYETICDTEGERFHIVRILMSGETKLRHIWSFSNLPNFENTSPGDVGRRVTPRITGTPRTPRHIIAPSKIVPDAMKLELDKHLLWKQFESEWDQVNINDVVRSKAQRELFKQATHPVYASFQRIFQYLSSSDKESKIGCTTVSEAIEFLRDQNICPNVTDKNQICNAMNIEDSGEGPRRQIIPLTPALNITRGKFFEVVIRCVLINAKDDLLGLYDQALKRIYALEVTFFSRDIQEELKMPEIQGEFKLLDRPLRLIFSRRSLSPSKEIQEIGAKQFFDMVQHVTENITHRQIFYHFGMSKRPEDVNGRQEVMLCYDEWLIALGRIANLDYERLPLNLATKTKRFLQRFLVANKAG